MITEFEENLELDTTYICPETLSKKIKKKNIQQDGSIIVCYENYLGPKKPVNYDDLAIHYHVIHKRTCDKIRLAEEKILSLKKEMDQVKSIKKSLISSNSVLRKKFNRMSKYNFDVKCCEPKKLLIEASLENDISVTALAINPPLFEEALPKITDEELEKDKDETDTKKKRNKK